MNFGVVKIVKLYWSRFYKSHRCIAIAAAITGFIALMIASFVGLNGIINEFRPGWVNPEKYDSDTAKKIFSFLVIVWNPTVSILISVGLLWWTYICFEWAYEAEKKEQAALSAVADLERQVELQQNLFKDLIDHARHCLNYSSQRLSNFYTWFSEMYREGEGYDTVKSYCSVAGATREIVETESIESHLRSGKMTATDFLGVISADQQHKLLSSFTIAFQYFSKFDRIELPRDRLTRIFSVPAPSVKMNGMKSEIEWGSQAERVSTSKWRQNVLLALLVNKICGVDTKLHVYQKGASDLSFFVGADYVLCIDPASDEESPDHKVMYLAVPEDEENSLKITKSSEIHSTFHYEFYRRLTDGADPAHTHQQVIDFTRGKTCSAVEALGLNHDECSLVKTELLQLIDSKGQNFDKERWSNAVNSWPFPQS